MKVHFIIHESFEAPGALELWANNRGFDISYTRIYQGDSFPQNCDFDFLFVMGGPQSPATTPQECPHFDSKKEKAFIKKAADENKILLGICLGAQMIGEALGGTFDHSPNREIGVYPVNLTEDGKQDPIFRDFPPTFQVGHWHGDMPGLTPESRILAASEGCPRQIIRYTSRIYGFQCHFEFTPETIEGMIQSCSSELEQYKDFPYIQDAKQLRSNSYTEINNLLFRFLDRLTALHF